MRKIATISLIDILPPNLVADESVKRAAQALDTELQLTSLQVRQCLILTRLDELGDEEVDLLAWQFKVDFYDASLPIARKRNLVRESIAWHRKKGTPGAVQEIVDALIDGATVVEKWEYEGGKPYHFKVIGVEGPMVDEETINSVVAAIKAAKNTRSHLDGIAFKRTINGTVFRAGYTEQHKTIAIGPAKFNAPSGGGVSYRAGYTYTHKEVTIG